MEETGVTAIDIEDDGKVLWPRPAAMPLTKRWQSSRGMMQEPEIGKIYEATVKRVMNLEHFAKFCQAKKAWFTFPS